MMLKIRLFTLVFMAGLCTLAQAQTDLYLDSSQPVNVRVNDLIHKLTLDQKITQMNYASPAIPELKIPAYNWWSESLHGVARSGTATIFPQAIALGATFDDDLAFRVANSISDEARAMHNAAVAQG